MNASWSLQAKIRLHATGKLPKEYGLKEDGTVITDFDLIEMNEGRWYPEMWRDAWK